MAFLSLRILEYLILAFAGYHLTPVRFRFYWLLGLNVVFYASFGLKPSLLLLVLLLANYGIAFLSTPGRKSRLAGLALALIANLGVLFLFKYLGFFSRVFDAAPDSLSLALHQFGAPIGISFYSFRQLSYLFDVRSGVIAPERNLARFAAYVSLCFEIQAGPIDRARDLAPQLAQPHPLRFDDVRDAILLLLWGLLKKLVIADRLVAITAPGFSNPNAFSGYSLLWCGYLYAFQIYFDFSGYTDMMRGFARLFGIRLAINFNVPYLATSIADFWRRWHITLSNWLRDYLFLPLAGWVSDRFVGKQWSWFDKSLLIYGIASLGTWFLGGLWHGAAWTFIVWGLMHGIYLVIENLLQKPRRRWRKKHQLQKRIPFIYEWTHIFFTFNLIVAAWIVFRAENLTLAGSYLERIFLHFPNHQGVRPEFLTLWNLIPLAMMAAVLILEFGNARHNWWVRFQSAPAWLRWIAYDLLILLVLLYRRVDAPVEFIYLRF
jgi:alginate O-acetyltransferase complex protein AlgI